jgi:hypothetical protein
MESQYYIRQGAKITGPLTAETVKKMAAGGGLDRHDEVSADAKKWSFAEEIPGLRFGGPASIDQPYYVFLSYCPENQREADVLCKALEASQIPCWMASRDILPGVEPGEATTEALDASRIVVLLLSDKANQSPGVSRQIDRAADKHRSIITFRLQNVLPRGSMEYYLSNTHWFDAFDGSVEEHAAELAGVIRRVLRKEKLAGSDTEISLRLAETLREMPVRKRTPPETPAATQPSPPKVPTANPRKLIIAGLACAVLGILAAGLFFWRSYGSTAEFAQRGPTSIDPKPVEPKPVEPKPVPAPTPDPPSPDPPADIRKHWAGKTQHQFVKVGDKEWSEQELDGTPVHVCDEIGRTDSYVELLRKGTSLRIRLYEGYLEFNPRGRRDWQRIEAGKKHPNQLPAHGTWQ